MAGATHEDVQLARYEFFKRFVPVCYIIASWVPFKAAQPIADALAGKHTHVTITVSVTLTFSVIVGGTAFAMWRKSVAQRAELVRLRRRINILEQELAGKGGP